MILWQLCRLAQCWDSFLLNAACMPATAKASLLQLSSIVVFGPVGSSSLCLLNLTRHHWQSGTQPHMSHVLGWGLAPAFVWTHTTAFCVPLYSTPGRKGCSERISLDYTLTAHTLCYFYNNMWIALKLWPFSLDITASIKACTWHFTRLIFSCICYVKRRAALFHMKATGPGVSDPLVVLFFYRSFCDLKIAFHYMWLIVQP